jgi:transcriptional regulator with XRE-family HTH domain
MSRGGDLIREARRRAGLTQAELAERVGTTQSAVARWERGRVAPSLDTTLRVLRSIGYDLDYMLVEHDDSDMAQAKRMLALTTNRRVVANNHTVEVMRAFQGAARDRAAADA